MFLNINIHNLEIACIVYLNKMFKSLLNIITINLKYIIHNI